MSTSVSNLHTSAVSEADERHARAVKVFMSLANVNVMGLTEAHSKSFERALTNVFTAKRVLQSEEKKNCALVSVLGVWDKDDAQCVEFNRQMYGTRTFFKLNDAIAGKLKGSDVVYIVAYGSSGSSKAEDMAFLRAIEMACMNMGWMDSEETTKIVLMGDWNTTSDAARGAVTASMDPYFHLPRAFLPTTCKERTWAQQQMHKAHKKDHQAKDFVLVSSGLTLLSKGASRRYYVSVSKTVRLIRPQDKLVMLPSPGTHFSDHVAVVTSWSDETGTRHNTGTLNVMSDAYNAFEFHDSNPDSLSAIVDNVLAQNQQIDKSKWDSWIDAIQSTARLWQQGRGQNYDVVAELQKRRCPQTQESFDIWNVHVDDSTNYFSSHKEFKTGGKMLSKMYSMGNGNYRPDITSFNYASNPQEGLQAFQDCVDAEDNSEKVAAWVEAMLNSIYGYTKDGKNPWRTAANAGHYYHPDGDYNFTFAQHAAVCLLMGMWMIDCIRTLKRQPGAESARLAARASGPLFRLRLRIE
tara:strand:+ start:1370 stop:2935 length:1566 start_codon:yes stop_codon:yes gene_type:complete